jgi:hypothetical protein
MGLDTPSCGRLTHIPFVYWVSFAIMALIVLAEVVSWHSVLTTDQRGHMAENSLWGIASALMVTSLLVIGPARLPNLYWPMIVCSIAGTAYAGFIFFSDVPMYWSRWRADQRNNRRYLTIAAGITDTRRRWVLSHRWEDWKDEIVWMSLYFSFGVWSSISLIYAALTL